MAQENGYLCFWNGMEKEIYAETAYAAQKKAAVEFQKSTRKKVKEYDVDVHLCVRADGSQVIHTAVD